MDKKECRPIFSIIDKLIDLRTHCGPSISEDTTVE